MNLDAQTPSPTPSIIPLAVIVALAALMLTACGSFEKDLDNMCTVATEMEGDTTVAADMKAMTMAKRIDEKGLSRTGRTVFDALANAAPDSRYPLLQAAAKEEGIDNWECDALKRAWGPAPEVDKE